MPKLPDKSNQQIIPVESIQQRIYLIRGHKVMLDSDLAELYGVPTRRLNENEQVKRNRKRFPEDFMFRLTRKEVDELNRSQFATVPRSTATRGSRRMFLLNTAQ